MKKLSHLFKKIGAEEFVLLILGLLFFLMLFISKFGSAVVFILLSNIFMYRIIYKINSSKNNTIEKERKELQICVIVTITVIVQMLYPMILFFSTYVIDK